MLFTLSRFERNRAEELCPTSGDFSLQSEPQPSASHSAQAMDVVEPDELSCLFKGGTWHGQGPLWMLHVVRGIIFHLSSLLTQPVTKKIIFCLMLAATLSPAEASGGSISTHPALSGGQVLRHGGKWLPPVCLLRSSKIPLAARRRFQPPFASGREIVSVLTGLL